MDIPREEIERIARQAGMADVCWQSEISFLLLSNFAKLVAAYEREECAKVAESVDYQGSVNLKLMRNRIVNKIRDRV